MLSIIVLPMLLAGQDIPTIDYGLRPSFEEGVKIGEAYIRHDLADPYSAHFTWENDFVAFSEKVPMFKRTTGYATCVTVNAKNLYGAYVGEQTYRITIRNGAVIDYARVSDLKLVPDICKELSMKFGMGPAPAR